MTTPFPFPERVPYSAAERLLRDLSTLLETIEDALQIAPATSTEAARWQRARSILQAEWHQLQSETETSQNGATPAFLQHATALKMLVRRMDGYSLDFAGDPLAEKLQSTRQRIVLTSWQIAAAASGSEAAGL